MVEAGIILKRANLQNRAQQIGKDGISIHIREAIPTSPISVAKGEPTEQVNRLGKSVTSRSGIEVSKEVSWAGLRGRVHCTSSPVRTLPTTVEKAVARNLPRRMTPVIVRLAGNPGKESYPAAHLENWKQPAPPRIETTESENAPLQELKRERFGKAQTLHEKRDLPPGVGVLRLVICQDLKRNAVLPTGGRAARRLQTVVASP